MQKPGQLQKPVKAGALRKDLRCTCIQHISQAPLRKDGESRGVGIERTGCPIHGLEPRGDDGPRRP